MATIVKEQNTAWLQNLFYEYQILRRFGWEEDYILQHLTKAQMLDMLKELTILDSNYIVIHDDSGSGEPGDGEDDEDDMSECPDNFESDWLRINKPKGVLTGSDLNKNSWLIHFKEKYKDVDFYAMEESDIQILLDQDGFFMLLQYNLNPKLLSKDMLIYYLNAIGMIDKRKELSLEDMKNLLIHSDLYSHEDEEKLAYIPLLLTEDMFSEFNKGTVFDVSYKLIFRGTDVNAFSSVQTYLNNIEQYLITCDDETETLVDIYKSYDYDKKGFITYEWTNHVVQVRFRYKVGKTDEQIMRLGWGLNTTKRSPELKIAIGDIKIKAV